MTARSDGGGVSNFPFDCIGFDLDGTLLHTGRELAASLNHALTAGGYDALPADAAIKLIGGGAHAMLTRALKLHGETDEQAAERLFPLLLDHYAEHLGEDSDIYPGLLDALDTLAERNVKLAVVTNKNEALSRALLDRMGLTERFGLIIGGDTLGPDRKKPKPDMLRHMLSGMNAKKALFIGDSEFDAGAAKAAAIPFVAVSFGYATVDLATLGADRIIDHYDQLIPVLESWPRS